MTVVIEQEIIDLITKIAPIYLTSAAARLSWAVEVISRQADRKFLRMVLAQAASIVSIEPAQRQAFVSQAVKALETHQVIPKAADCQATKPESEPVAGPK